MDDPIVIISAKRTPIGRFLGVFKDVPAPHLGAAAIKACLDHSQITPAQIDEVIMGCVLSAGVKQAPARQAALQAGLPDSVACTTINKICGSGMKAIMIACDAITAGSAHIIIAGGMESMSNAPRLLLDTRSGKKIGHQKIWDHLYIDGLEEASNGQLMGEFVETLALRFSLTRDQLDDWAQRSLTRAQQNNKPADISAVSSMNQDENVQHAQIAKIAHQKPVFSSQGMITAANASGIADGAAAVLLMKQSTAQQYGLTPIAIIDGYTEHAGHPHEFALAPVGATQKLLAQLKRSVDEIDLFEINEAFAAVTLMVMQQLNIPAEKVNVLGGACALGHPLGATGARLTVTLINALHQHHKTQGVATLCIGGGEATAMAIRRL